jgi:hypothetical protein
VEFTIDDEFREDSIAKIVGTKTIKKMTKSL